MTIACRVVEVVVTEVLTGAIIGWYGMSSVIALGILRHLPRTIDLGERHPLMKDYEAVLRPAFIWRVRVYAGLGVLLCLGWMGWHVARIVTSFIT